MDLSDIVLCIGNLLSSRDDVYDLSIPFAAQGRAAQRCLAFGPAATRSPAARGPLSLLWA